jgi:hypothetical protein
VFPVAAIRRELIRAGIRPGDVHGIETVAAIVVRSITHETIGAGMVGPGVWVGEQP